MKLKTKDYYLLRITAAILNIVFVTAVVVELAKSVLSRSANPPFFFLLLTVITLLFTFLVMISKRSDAHDDSYLKGLVAKANSLRGIMYLVFKNTLLETKAIHGILALPFVWFPLYEFDNLTGRWYSIGWPIPSGGFALTDSVWFIFIRPQFLGVFIMLPLWAFTILLISKKLNQLNQKIGPWSEIPRFIVYAFYAFFCLAFVIATHSLWSEILRRLESYILHH
jgi:hypothetical protein